MRVVVVAVATLATSTAPANAMKQSAFGFDKGMTLKQAKAVASLKQAPHDPYLYVTEKAPRPVAPFTSYAIMVGPTAGVCMVMAQTAHLPDLEKVKSDYGYVLDVLVERYGAPTRSTPGALDQEHDWSEPLGPNTLLRLELQKNADGTRHVMLSYLFSNMVKCLQEVQSGL